MIGTMSPAECRRIRLAAGLTLDGLAAVLRIGDLSTIHRWEKGARPISGPASVVLNAIDRGLITVAEIQELPD
jgi:DNA-binding transcriptional regulator YiaG